MEKNQLSLKFKPIKINLNTSEKTDVNEALLNNYLKMMISLQVLVESLYSVNKITPLSKIIDLDEKEIQNLSKCLQTMVHLSDHLKVYFE